MRILCAYYPYMRRLCVYAHMMRRCAYDAYLRKLCVYAHIMRRCANDAYMRRLRVYVPYGRGRKMLRIPRENGPGGRGLGNWAGSAPSLFCLVFRCVSEPQETLTYIYPPARHAGPRGRRTSPACGSCRRPLKKKKQGIEKTERAKIRGVFRCPSPRILCADAYSAHTMRRGA